MAPEPTFFSLLLGATIIIVFGVSSVFLVPYLAGYNQQQSNLPSIVTDMNIITDSKRILSLQHKLKKRLTDLMPDTAMRRVDIPKINTDISVNHNITIKKWYYYRDNVQSHKHTFYVGNWKYGGGNLPYTGSISISWDGSGSNAGIFVKEATEVYLLHSGNMGRKTKKNFFEAYQGETKQIEINDEIKKYAVIGRMDDPDIASNVVNFFDFLIVT